MAFCRCPPWALERTPDIGVMAAPNGTKIASILFALGMAAPSAARKPEKSVLRKVMKKLLIQSAVAVACFLLAYAAMPVMTKESARVPGAPDGRPGTAKHSAIVLNLADTEEPGTVSEKDSDVYFDHESQGRAVKTGWIGPEAGLLVMDRSGDGRINDGRELFGNHTLDGGPGQSGFEALAREDTNHDGRLNAEDDNWNRLMVWRSDSQGDPSRRGLSSLGELGLEEVELLKVPLRRHLANGNYIQATGSFRYADGRRGQLAEVYFQQNDFYRRFTTALTPPPALANSLLYLGGSGLVRDLQEALIQSPGLREVAERFRRAATRREQRALVDALLTAWASTSGLAPTIEERAAGRYTVVDNGLGPRPAERARRLHVMEAFNGTYFYPLPDELTPAQSAHPNVQVGGPDGRNLTVVFTPKQTELLDQAYDLLAESVYGALAGQTRLARFLKPLSPEPGARAGADQELARLAEVTELFDKEIARDPENGLIDLLDFRIILANLAEQSAGIVVSRTAAHEALDRYIETRIRGRSLTDEQEELYEKMKRIRAANEPVDPAQGGW